PGKTSACSALLSSPPPRPRLPPRLGLSTTPPRGVGGGGAAKHSVGSPRWELPAAPPICFRRTYQRIVCSSTSSGRRLELASDKGLG
uniref:Uncharacterized protein n=1 Tax=Triticum urartu TaxID=4572 RepID=A0A8R7U898_TRIUA